MEALESLCRPVLPTITSIASLFSSLQPLSPKSDRGYGAVYAESSNTRKGGSLAQTQPLDFIDRLPHDILIAIFTLVLTCPPSSPTESDVIPSSHPVALSERPSHTPTINSSNQTTPFPLSHVCRRWMRAVCTTPSFWRQIYIEGPNSRQVFRAAVWVLRAAGAYGQGHIDENGRAGEGGSGMGIEVDIVQLEHRPSPNGAPEEIDAQKEQDEHTLQILEILSFAVQKWSRLRIHLRSGVPRALVTHLQKLGVEQIGAKRALLQEVELAIWPPPNVGNGSSNHGSIGSGDVDPTTFNLLSAVQCLLPLPNLTSFIFSAPFTPGCGFNKRLKRLHLASPLTIEEMLRTIVGLEALVKLKVESLYQEETQAMGAVEGEEMDVDMDADADMAPYNSNNEDGLRMMPSLKYLTLRTSASRPTSLSSLLERLVLPSLRVLRISSPSVDVDPDVVQGLLRRSECAPRLLSFLLSNPPETPAANSNTNTNRPISKFMRWLTIPEIQNVRWLMLEGFAIDNEGLAWLERRPHLHRDPFAQYQDPLDEPPLHETFHRPNSYQRPSQQEPSPHHHLQSYRQPSVLQHHRLYPLYVVCCPFPRLRGIHLSKISADADDGLLLRMLGSRYWTVPGVGGASGLPFWERGSDELQDLEDAVIGITELTRNMRTYRDTVNQCGTGERVGSNNGGGGFRKSTSERERWIKILEYIEP